jgi:hypothetical protein
MTESRDEERLRRLLDDTLSTVEPEDRLDQIRQRTKVTPMSARRPWLWAGGAALATAAVITAVAMAGNPLQKANEPGPQTSTTPTQVTEPSPTQTTTPPASAGGALPVYFIGDTPQGPRLYREFDANVDNTEPVSTAVSLALGPASDPDYRTGWPAGAAVTTAGLTPDLITIGLSGDLHDRPAGMTQAEAGMAIQQLIYTAQAAYGHGRVPVQFLLNDSHTDKILGEPASEPLAEGTWYKTLSLVNITDPSEGTHVSGTLHVTGLASSFEANVPWQILQGTKVVDQKFFTAAQGGDLVKLYPFAGDIDLSALAPGTYTLRVQTDDPSGGAGPGPMSDTRTIVVE